MPAPALTPAGVAEIATTFEESSFALDAVAADIHAVTDQDAPFTTVAVLSCWVQCGPRAAGFRIIMVSAGPASLRGVGQSYRGRAQSAAPLPRQLPDTAGPVPDGIPHITENAFHGRSHIP